MLLTQIFLWHHCNRDRYTKHALSFQRWTQRIIWRKRLWSSRSWCNNSWRNLCCRWGLFESPGKNSREAIVGLHLGLGWRIKLYPSLSCISSLRCSFLGVCETRDGKDIINSPCPSDDHCVIELGTIAVLYSQTLTKGLAGHDNKPCIPFL